MKIILEYKSFNDRTIIMKKISDELSDILPYVRVSRNVIMASSIVDKSGKPIVRIDSKVVLKGLLLKFNKDFITIKSIVNSTPDKGFSTDVIRILLGSIGKGYTIKIDQDVSNGFWDNIIKKYPEYNWIKF